MIAQSKDRSTFPLAGMWRWQVLGGLLAIAGAISFVWNAGGVVAGPVFIWLPLGVLVVVGASNGRVEINDRAINYTAPPITWVPTIPLGDIEYVAEVDLTSCWRACWSTNWLTFWPFGRAVLLKRRNATLFRPSVVFLVDGRQDLLQSLREVGVPVEQT